jgi:predicted helicase
VKDYIGNKPLTKYELKTPLNHQQQIIKECQEYYKNNDYGKLYLACGTGKTFTGYWLSVRVLKMDKIFIVVPSLYLLSQTYETWYKETQYDDKKYNFLLIGSDLDKNDEITCEYNLTTDMSVIKKCLKNNDKIVVITTYHSSKLLVNVCKKLKYKFKFGIYDEAHRSVGDEDKRFTVLLSSKIEKKRLFMTATEKIYNYKKKKKNDEEKEKVLSMDNESVYGKVIFKYSMKQAIDDDVLVNYRLIAPFMNTDEYSEDLLNNNFVKHKKEEIEKYDIRTIMTALMIIINMKKYKFKHLLIFSNTNERAKNLIEFIKMYLDETEPEHNINCKYLSGNDNMNKRKFEVKDFENSEYGIISSVRIFGEGVDIKICDSICFSDSKSSSVDIVQYVGRCLRKCRLIENKLSYVLIPFMMDNETKFFDYENKSYLKLRKILKTIGTTDEMVTEKFIIMNCNYKKSDKGKSEVKKKVSESKFDMEEFKKKLISKVFDRSGDEIDMTRNKVIFENTRRYKNGEKLIDTRKKCIDFLRKNNINEELQNIKNWIRYCFGEKLFDIIKNDYYVSLDEFKIACEKYNITNSESYKKYYGKDKKLPSYDFINNGFYSYIDNKFNLTDMLTKGKDDCEF